MVVSSGMSHRVALVRTDVSEKLSASFMMVSRIGELSEELSASIIRVTRNSYFTDSCHPDDGGAKFFRNVGSYKSHTA
jgi:hypothetical protein